MLRPFRVESVGATDQQTTTAPEELFTRKERVELLIRVDPVPAKESRSALVLMASLSQYHGQTHSNKSYRISPSEPGSVRIELARLK